MKAYIARYERTKKLYLAVRGKDGAIKFHFITDDDYSYIKEKDVKKISEEFDLYEKD